MGRRGITFPYPSATCLFLRKNTKKGFSDPLLCPFWSPIITRRKYPNNIPADPTTITIVMLIIIITIIIMIIIIIIIIIITIIIIMIIVIHSTIYIPSRRVCPKPRHLVFRETLLSPSPLHPRQLIHISLLATQFLINQ